jgi:hypothetical protein
MRAQVQLQRQQLQQQLLPAADQLTPIPSCWYTNIHCSSLARALLPQPRQQQQQLLPAHYQPFLAGAGAGAAAAGNTAIPALAAAAGNHCQLTTSPSWRAQLQVLL